MGSLLVIADPEVVVGFRLAGVQAVAAGTPAEAERVLRERAGAESVSVVLLDQSLLEGLSEATRRRLERAGLPLVVPIPVTCGRGREERGEDYILGIIRRAIGFQMKIGARQ